VASYAIALFAVAILDISWMVIERGIVKPEPQKQSFWNRIKNILLFGKKILYF